MKNQYQTQVGKENYFSGDYLTPKRWSSYCQIINQVLLMKPRSILEIGPGNGIVTSILKQMGFPVKTLDFDGRLNPDYTADVTNESLPDIIKEKFDLVIAAQVFEHIRYEDFLKAVGNLAGIAVWAIVSLPHTTDNSFLMSFGLKIPLFKKFSFVKKIIYKKKAHQFNGQHYWEIGKSGYSLNKVRRDILRSGWKIEKEFLNPENSYHYFFILKI